MRIDEFSNPSDLDGMFTPTEQTQFMLFGFDLALTIHATDPNRIFTPVFENRVFTPVFENRVRAIPLGG